MFTFVLTLAAFLAARRAIERRADAASAVHWFKMAWFACVSVYELRLLSSASASAWLPPCLGGASNKPIFTQAPADELGTFYHVQLAYHVHSLVYALVVGAKPEMHLHHVVTVLLVVFSDLLDFRRCGLVVFFLHDVPDITSGAIKASLQAGMLSVLIPSYVLHLFSWGYLRLVILARFVYALATDGPEKLEHRVGFSALLLCLLALHYYWYYLFIVMALRFKGSGKVRDVSEVQSVPAAEQAAEQAKAKAKAPQQQPSGSSTASSAAEKSSGAGLAHRSQRATAGN